MVKTSPSNTGDAGLISGWGIKIPHSSWPKNQSINRSNIVSDSIKTFKMVHIKKKKKLLKRKKKLKKKKQKEKNKILK